MAEPVRNHNIVFKKPRTKDMLTVEKKTETSDLWQILEFFFCIMEVISTLKMVSKKQETYLLYI